MARTWLLLLMAVTVALGWPHHHRDSNDVVYDQRQNGSDNVRVHLDGLVIIHAPAESLAALAASADTSDIEQQLAELLSSLGEDSSSTSTTTTTTDLPAEAASTTVAQDSGANSSQASQEDEIATPDKPQKNEGTSPEKPQNNKTDASDVPQEDTEAPKEKPEKDKEGSTEEPQEDKPPKKNRHRVRLSSLLIPFLRRIE